MKRSTRIVRLTVVVATAMAAATAFAGPSTSLAASAHPATVRVHPAITGAIVGARNAKQAEGVMRAGELKLTAAEVAEIEGVAAAVTAR